MSLSDVRLRQTWFRGSSPGVAQLRDLRAALAVCPPPCPRLTFLICAVGSAPTARVFQGSPCLQRLLSIQQVLPQRELPDGGDGDWDRNHRTPSASRPPAALLLALHHCQPPAPCYVSSRASREVNSSFSRGYLALSESLLPLPSLWGKFSEKEGTPEAFAD